MNEKEFSERIRECLDQGTQQIDGITLSRLEQARQRALGKVRVAERQVAVSASQGNGRGATALRLGGGSDQHHPHHLRLLFVGLALIAAMAGTLYWQQANDDDDEQDLLDAKMLSSELPLHAFTHPDFKEWVDTSH